MEPITVNASPTPAQISAGFRQAVIAAGSILATFGLADASSHVNELVGYAGAVGAVGAFIWGQLSTRAHAKKAAKMANALPNHVAVTK